MIEWRTFITTVSAAALLAILSVAWMSYNRLQELTWQAPIVMERIAKIEKKVDRIERLVMVDKEKDELVSFNKR